MSKEPYYMHIIKFNIHMIPWLALYKPRSTKRPTIGVCSTYYDWYMNDTFEVLMFEVDDDSPHAYRRAVEALDDMGIPLLMTAKTRRGYHFYCDTGYIREEVVDILRKLVDKGVADAGWFKLVEKRYEEDVPFLAVLRVAGKYKRHDIKIIYSHWRKMSKWHRIVYEMIKHGRTLSG